MSAPAAEPTSAGPIRPTSQNEFLRYWESRSELSDKQQSLCEEVERLIAGTKFLSQPGPVRSKLDSDSSKNGDRENAGDNGTPDADAKESKGLEQMFGDEIQALEKITTTEGFRVWYEEIERRLEEANEKKYHSLIEGLQDGQGSCKKLNDILQSSEEDLEMVKVGRETVTETTSRFKLACENLVAEKERHLELADALRRRLTYFEELETLSVKFGNGRGSVSPSSPDFIKYLHRLYECIAYAGSSSGAVVDADGYLAKFVDLQRRAFTSMKDYTIGELKTATQQVLKEQKQSGVQRVMTESDLTDAAKEYLKFRTLAPRLKVLMDELLTQSQEQPKQTAGTDFRGQMGNENVSTNPMYSTRSFALTALGDCEEYFVEQRRRILETPVMYHLRELSSTDSVIDGSRSASSFILQLCRMEALLYEKFFATQEDKEPPALVSLLDTFCSILYEVLRSRIVQEGDLDTLVYLIEILRNESLSIEPTGRSVGTESFAKCTARCVADAQERIIYRAQVYIQEEIRNFTPRPEDLKYPDIIINAGAEASVSSSPKIGGKKNRTLYSTWYPPVERTLKLLSMLYRCIDGEAFAGIASEAVAMCVVALKSAGEQISSTKSNGGDNGSERASDHGDLFLIWQMLMLREQTSPFDVEFSFVDRELDFTELRDLVGNVIRGQSSFRMLATPPSATRERVVDQSRELDRAFFDACENFVFKLTRRFLDPVLSFLAKCNALPASSKMSIRIKSPQLGASDRTSVPSTQNEGFLQLDTVKEMWTKVQNHILAELPDIVRDLKVYLPKPASAGVLLHPVRANFAEAFNELLSALQTLYTLEEREELEFDGQKITGLLATVDEIMNVPRASTAGK